MRLPTTARIALLAMLLALLSNVALLSFIHLRTRDAGLTALRQRVIEEAAAEELAADAEIDAEAAVLLAEAAEHEDEA